MWQKFLIKFFSWLTIFSTHTTICVSDKTKRDVSNWPLIRNKLRVVRNGVETFELLPRAEARRALGIHDDNTLVVGNLSELHPIKGLDILIEAWDKFSKNRDVQLIILGEGEARKDLEELITVLGLTRSITLRGYVENAKQYLKAFDIFCLPSRSEALPYSLLEAGIASLPVVASHVGGIPEIIESGLNGVLVEPENSDELFSTLLLLSESQDVRIRLGDALRETILKDFSIQKMAEQTFKLY
jgi:glycosyltransferase involved in cell wall biosynthesis